MVGVINVKLKGYYHGTGIKILLHNYHVKKGKLFHHDGTVMNGPGPRTYSSEQQALPKLLS